MDRFRARTCVRAPRRLSSAGGQGRAEERRETFLAAALVDQPRLAPGQTADHARPGRCRAVARLLASVNGVAFDASATCRERPPWRSGNRQGRRKSDARNATEGVPYSLAWELSPHLSPSTSMIHSSACNTWYCASSMVTRSTRESRSSGNGSATILSGARTCLSNAVRCEGICPIAEVVFAARLSSFAGRSDRGYRGE